MCPRAAMHATSRRTVLFYLKPDDSCELYDDESILCEQQAEEESVLRVRLKLYHKLRRRRLKKRLGPSPAVDPAVLDVPAPRTPAPDDPSRAARHRMPHLDAEDHRARPPRDDDPRELDTRGVGGVPKRRRTRARPGFYLALATQGRRATIPPASSAFPPRDGVVACADAGSASAREPLPNRPVPLLPSEPARPPPPPPPRTQRTVAEENMRTLGMFSRFRGVSFDRRHGRWKCAVGKRWCGYHDTESAAARAYNEVARILGAPLNDVSDGDGDGDGFVVLDVVADAGTLAGTAARASLAVAQPSNVASLEAEGNTNGSSAGLEATQSPGSFAAPSPAVPFASPSGWFLPRCDMNRHVDPDETDVDDDSDDEAAGLPPRSPPERKPRWAGGGARAKDEVVGGEEPRGGVRREGDGCVRGGDVGGA